MKKALSNYQLQFGVGSYSLDLLRNKVKELGRSTVVIDLMTLFTSNLFRGIVHACPSFFFPWINNVLTTLLPENDKTQFHAGGAPW